MKTVKRLVVLIAALMLTACNTDPDDAVRTAQNMGFRDVQTGDWAFGECGHGDFNARRFSGVNPLGVRVQGFVCCGIAKGCTIRF